MPFFNFDITHIVPTRGAAENGRQVAVVLERPDLPDSNDDAATAPARGASFTTELVRLLTCILGTVGK